jgi:hypothetical protein
VSPVTATAPVGNDYPESTPGLVLLQPWGWSAAFSDHGDLSRLPQLAVGPAVDHSITAIPEKYFYPSDPKV